MTERMLDRRYIITGAASGIGLACVELFAAEGAQLGCFDRDSEGLHALKSRFNAQVDVFVVDVAQADQVARAVAEFASGGLAGVVNSAGVDLVAALDDLG